MNHLTNFYKNKCKHLQEHLNVLNYKIKQLNEMSAPPFPPFGDDDFYRHIQRLIARYVTTNPTKRINPAEFIAEFNRINNLRPDAIYRWHLPGFGHLYHLLPREFLETFLEGIARMGERGFILSKDGKYLFELMPNGTIKLVKNSETSPWGAWSNGTSRFIERGWKPLPRGGYMDPSTGQRFSIGTGGALIPLFGTEDQRDDDSFRVDREPPDSATPTPETTAPKPVRNWSQDWHP